MKLLGWEKRCRARLGKEKVNENRIARIGCSIKREYCPGCIGKRYIHMRAAAAE
jgi:hypothetical protein